jgi:hypothetical protein
MIEVFSQSLQVTEYNFEISNRLFLPNSQQVMMGLMEAALHPPDHVLFELFNQ